ncbi:peptidoglycan-binding domain-containing protein [Hamadaea tsunoensis]|uniref:peptidoglycan-binding domain-containing protein n=1 Tax=Hamadaea tsunoensis TaxID=53368 RepID=UPI0003FA1798|nr:peptidoglycan-binding domain-containing protein [Hamadaea tsunoensis]
MPARTPRATRRRCTAAAILLALIAGLLVTIASPASASTPYCRTSTWQGTAGRTILVPAAPSGWRCYMGRGAHSTAVAALQRSMNTCYPAVIGARLRVDGVFGPRTQTALLRVQRRLHIHRDGIYGPQTALAMRHIAYGGGCDTISHPGG